MIFVTVGSTAFPFERMSTIVSQLQNIIPSNQYIIYQYGASSVPKGRGINAMAYLHHDDLLSYMKHADVILSHAGPATIYESLSFGTIPWVLPRQHQYKEHVNNHQVTFATFLKRRNLVRIITQETAPSDLLKARHTKPRTFTANMKLIEYLDSVTYG